MLDDEFRFVKRKPLADIEHGVDLYLDVNDFSGFGFDFYVEYAEFIAVILLQAVVGIPVMLARGNEWG